MDHEKEQIMPKIPIQFSILSQNFVHKTIWKTRIRTASK